MMVNDVNESIKIRINLEKQALDIQKLRETLARLIHEIQDSGRRSVGNNRIML